MSRLYDRYLEIIAGLPGERGRTWRNISASFDIATKERAKGAKAVVKMYNLAPESIGLLEQKGAVISVIAGYADSYSLLFHGDIAKRGVNTMREGETLVTTIEAGASEAALREVRSDFSLGANSTTHDVVKKCATALGVGPGNIGDLAPLSYLTGYAHLGLVRSVLDEVADHLGCRWSIVNGALQFLKPDEATRETAVLLTPSTGLVGAPTRTKDGLECVSLLNPEIRPGRKIKVESELIDAFYKVTEVRFTGDTHGEEWDAKIKAKKIPGQ